MRTIEQCMVCNWQKKIHRTYVRNKEINNIPWYVLDV